MLKRLPLSHTVRVVLEPYEDRTKVEFSLEAIALVGDANAKLSLKDYTDRTKEVLSYD